MALGGGDQKVQVQQIDQERGSLILGETLLLDASFCLGLRKHSKTMWKHLMTVEAVRARDKRNGTLPHIPGPSYHCFWSQGRPSFPYPGCASWLVCVLLITFMHISR